MFLLRFVNTCDGVDDFELRGANLAFFLGKRV